MPQPRYGAYLVKDDTRVEEPNGMNERYKLARKHI